MMVSASWGSRGRSMSLNKEELARADLRSGERVIRRGRPPSVAPKQAVKLRLDPDVVEPFPRHRPWLADPHQCEALSHLASNGFAAARNCPGG
jgi:hypothetical protein